MAADVAKLHFRLVLLGSNGTGKTSILNRFLFKKFETKYRPTVEDLFSKEFDLGSLEIKVDFLDTSGSMQFPAMRRLSITTGSAFLIVYSVDDESSYEVVKMCMSEIQEIRPDFQEIPIVFVGNKCDIPRTDRKVTKELVSNYVYYELPRLRTKVVECSCKDDLNVDNIFKAYLSLARVSLSATVSNNHLTKKRPSNVPASVDERGSGANSPNDSPGNQKRSSSVKIALGVRKSCDATITTSMKKLSISSNRSSKEQLATMKEVTSATPQPGAGHLHSQKSDEVSIKDALQQSNRLGVEHGPKPRSRSLIWRPQRKSSRNSNESSDCHVS